jgi:uncharacterized delta-60 repeat protein
MNALRKALFVAVALVLGGFWGLAASALAAPGDLDLTFGTAGRVGTNFSTDLQDVCRSLAVQGDGKILMAGFSDSNSTDPIDFELARYTSTGALDVTFGSGGKVTTDLSNRSNDYAQCMAVQSDGKILVAGYAYSGDFSSYYYTSVLARYTETGALDTAFGTQGKVFGLISLPSQARGLAIQADGKILMAGVKAASLDGPGNLALARCTAEGARDTGFGVNGTVITDFGSDDVGFRVKVLDGGKILVGGYSGAGLPGDRVVLARYTDAGELDLAFGTDGKVMTSMPVGQSDGFDMVVRSDGSILVAGTTNNNSYYSTGALLCYTAGGVLDSSFGTNGRVNVPIAMTTDCLGSIAVQDDGKIFVAGVENGLSLKKFALVRYTAAGVLDASFGTGGKTTAPASNNLSGCYIALQTDRKIVAAGTAGSFYHRFEMVRFEGDPDPAANANLSALVLGAGELSPDFASATTSYSASVSYQTSSLAVTPTVEAANATIEVQVNVGGFVPVASGEPSGPLTLNVGANSVEVKVTAPDGTTAKTYTATVTRAEPSANAELAGLTWSGGTLSPDFAAATTSYTASVKHEVNSITVTAAKADANATVELQVNAGGFASVLSGDPSGPLSLNVGANLVVVKVTAQDGTTTKTYQFAVHRNALPMLTLPSLPISALATELGGVLVFFNVTASDAEDGAIPPLPSVASGAIFPIGTTTVTVSVTDSLGDSASGTFEVNVHLAAPVNTVVFRPGAAAPGAGTNGLPDEATLTSFRSPAIDDAGDLAFVASWKAPDGRRGTGLFLNLTCLAVSGGDASGVTGIPGAVWKSFTDPVVDSGHAICIATLGGEAKASAVVCNLTGSALEKIALTGEAASSDGAKWAKFQTVAVAGNCVAFMGRLATGTGTPRVTAANDTGIWLKAGADPLSLVLREGKTFLFEGYYESPPIKKLVSFQGGNGSPGQGRGWLRSTPAGGEVVAQVTYPSTAREIVKVDSKGVVSAFVESFQAATAGFDQHDIYLYNMGLPAVNAAGQCALRCETLTPVPEEEFVYSVDHSLVVDRVGDGSYYALETIDLFPGFNLSPSVTSFKDPVLAEDGGLAYAGTSVGYDYSLPNDPYYHGLTSRTVWWVPPGGYLKALARGGESPPGVESERAQWQSFTSLAVASNRGPIFVATMVPGRGGVTAASARGVWACDFKGHLSLLFRTGDPSILPGKTLRSFTVLNATPGATGVTRSFNNAQKVAWLATFTDRSQAIVMTEVP